MRSMRLGCAAPSWGSWPALVLACVCVLATPALAQPRPDADPPTKTTTQTNKSTDPAGGGKKQVVKTYDFNALDLNGRMRSPQLLYFLERASEELERASLEKRSFIPHLVRSLEEEAL